MATKTVKVNIELPEGVSEQIRRVVQTELEEAAVLSLWKAGEISTRRAAEELGLTYHDFVDLLAARGIPVVQGPLDVDTLENARKRLARDQP